jgi:ATP-dependent Lon protease
MPEDIEAGVPHIPIPLYSLDEVRAVLGTQDDAGAIEFGLETPRETEHQSRLSDILARGESGRWRDAVGPASSAEAEIALLETRAPHFSELIEIIITNLKAARTIGVPMFLNPVLLVGEPGIGKTWFLSRLSRALGLPFRTYSMSISTLGEGLQGAHPSWRNAEPGLVAKTLLRETTANPMICVDEFDKVQRGNWNADPYRPFYTLLDPSGSQSFSDEYLGFPIDASRILWVMAANDISEIPAPIMDRLTVLFVPKPSFEQRKMVIQSIYSEANARHLDFFDKTLRPCVAARLLPFNPRSVRLVVEAAMARAAAAGRRGLRGQDIRAVRSLEKPRIGFV